MVYQSSSCSIAGRNPEYIKVVTQLAVDIVIGGHIMAPFPDSLKLYVQFVLVMTVR